MYLDFAWRYFRAKKSANAINIISWIAAIVIAFATSCQVLVLSVFNGFEGMVQSLYSSFYTDIRIVPSKGKTFFIDPATIQLIKKQPYVNQISMIVEEQAMLQNGESQTAIQLKGVDDNFINTSGVPAKTTRGKFALGNAEDPMLVVGAGVQSAAYIIVNNDLAPEQMPIIMAKAHIQSNDPVESISEGFIKPSGVFMIQQDFDNTYAITNIDFVKQQSGIAENEFTTIEISLKKGMDMDESRVLLEKLLGNNYTVQTKYQQNASLYSTMKTEKWAIYAVLTLILIIAAFAMISALTMLVLEKKQDIAILQSLGSNRLQIKKIFLGEGLLLGMIGSAIGIGIATIICLLQMKFKFIKMGGGSFLIDYFPVKLLAKDFILVAATAMGISFIAAWFPAHKASRQPLELK